jgi:hypothetical protein
MSRMFHFSQYKEAVQTNYKAVHANLQLGWPPHKSQHMLSSRHVTVSPVPRPLVHMALTWSAETMKHIRQLFVHVEKCMKHSLSGGETLQAR